MTDRTWVGNTETERTKDRQNEGRQYRDREN